MILDADTCKKIYDSYPGTVVCSKSADGIVHSWEGGSICMISHSCIPEFVAMIEAGLPWEMVRVCDWPERRGELWLRGRTVNPVLDDFEAALIRGLSRMKL